MTHALIYEARCQVLDAIFASEDGLDERFSWLPYSFFDYK